MIDLDTSKAPMVVVRYIGTVTEGQLEHYLDTHRGLLESEAVHLLLVDLSRAEMGPNWRRNMLRLSEWVDDQAEGLRERCQAAAFLVRHPGVRQEIRDLFAERAPDFRFQTFESVDDALDWLTPFIRGLRGPAAGATDFATECADTLESTSPDVEPLSNRQTVLSREEEWSPYRSPGSGSS